MLSFFPRGVLDEILNLIESVSEGFPSYTSVIHRRRDKEIYSKCADAAIEKERVQRDKNGNMNNAAFYAVSSSSPYGY